LQTTAAERRLRDDLLPHHPQTSSPLPSSHPVISYRVPSPPRRHVSEKAMHLSVQNHTSQPTPAQHRRAGLTMHQQVARRTRPMQTLYQSMACMHISPPPPNPSHHTRTYMSQFRARLQMWTGWWDRLVGKDGEGRYTTHARASLSAIMPCAPLDAPKDPPSWPGRSRRRYAGESAGRYCCRRGGRVLLLHARLRVCGCGTTERPPTAGLERPPRLPGRAPSL
jgi:hypothetical protein